jgi:ATP-dependent DNA helicase RecQ
VTAREWQHALATLRDVFGLVDLRPGQEDVIRSVLAGRDTLAIMPTGAGKSLCYQLPGLMRRGTTVVVSPLISLMQDQAGKLEGTGIDATELHSALLKREAGRAADAVATGRAEFVLVTPERLAEPSLRDTLSGQAIDLVVVDDAHCVSQQAD